MKTIVIIIALISTLFAITKIEKITIIKANKYIEKGYYDKALKMLDKALKINPENDKLLTLKGKALKNMRKTKEANLILKKALQINPENLMARKLINDVQEIQQATQNETISAALDWLSDKGIDLLFIFLGVLGGELLIKALNECEANNDSKLIAKFVYQTIDRNDFKFSNFKCLFINVLIYLTVVSSITVVILLVELLVSPSYLEYIDTAGLWKHILAIYIVFIVYGIYKYVSKKEEDVTIAMISDTLTKYFHKDEFLMLRKDMKLLYLLEKSGKNEIVNQIFGHILFEEDKSKLKKLYENLKDGQKL
jgi:tetratricopeptide (TPR) repeat protein